MSDPRLPRTPRTPGLTDRRPNAPMGMRPGRDPQQPYINTHASLGSLARHLKLGLDRSKPMTTIGTHTLELLLDHVIAVGFGAQAVERYQAGAEWAADLAAATQALGEAQQQEAEREGEG